MSPSFIGIIQLKNGWWRVIITHHRATSPQTHTLLRHLVCFQDVGYAAHLSHRLSLIVSKKHIISQVFILFQFLYMNVISFLLLPTSSISVSASSQPPVTLDSPPFRVLWSLSLPPSCLAICRPLSVSCLWTDHQETGPLWWVQTILRLFIYLFREHDFNGTQE